MNLQWTEPQRELRRRYEDFGAAQVAPRVEGCWTRAEFDTESWQALADEGFWRIPVPVEQGGDGGGWWDFFAAYEGLCAGSRDFGFLITVGGSMGVVRALLEIGTQAQRDRWLGRLLGGGIAATALTEATGGSDVARVRTSAVANDGSYVLTGEKIHITNAPVADLAIVLGRLPELGPRDVTLFLVDGDAPGVRRGEPEQLLGCRSSPTGALNLDGALIDHDQVLGEPGEGLAAIAGIMALDRAVVALICASLIAPLVDEALAFAQEREAFKVRIAEHQYVQRRLTELVALRETTQFLAYGAIHRALADDPGASMTSSVAKLRAAEALCEATQHAIAIYGHRGYMLGPAARGVADALGARIGGGTEEMQRKNIFNQLLLEQASRREGAPWQGSRSV